MLDNRVTAHYAVDLKKSMSLKKKITSSKIQQRPLLERHDIIPLHNSASKRNFNAQIPLRIWECTWKKWRADTANSEILEDGNILVRSQGGRWSKGNDKASKPGFYSPSLRIQATAVRRVAR